MLVILLLEWFQNLWIFSYSNIRIFHIVYFSNYSFVSVFNDLFRHHLPPLVWWDRSLRRFCMIDCFFFLQFFGVFLHISHGPGVRPWSFLSISWFEPILLRENSSSLQRPFFLPMFFHFNFLSQRLNFIMILFFHLLQVLRDGRRALEHCISGDIMLWRWIWFDIWNCPTNLIRWTPSKMGVIDWILTHQVFGLRRRLFPRWRNFS